MSCPQKRGQLAASLCFRYPAPARQHETLRWWREIKEADNAPSSKCISGYSTSITDAKVLPKAPNFVASIIIINILFHIFHIIPNHLWGYGFICFHIFHIIPNHLRGYGHGLCAFVSELLTPHFFPLLQSHTSPV